MTLLNGFNTLGAHYVYYVKWEQQSGLVHGYEAYSGL
jgi:hypothetical protein